MYPNEIADRNRAIKQTLGKLYGRENVTVRGSRGTAYGWVHVKINRTPLDAAQAEVWGAEARAALMAAKVDLGRAYTDDDCRFEMDKCHIGFNSARFYRTNRTSDGAIWGQTYDSDAWVPMTPAESADARRRDGSGFVNANHD